MGMFHVRYTLSQRMALASLESPAEWLLQSLESPTEWLPMVVSLAWVPVLADNIL